MSRLKQQLVFAHQVDIYHHKNQFHINSQDRVYMVTNRTSNTVTQST